MADADGTIPMPLLPRCGSPFVDFVLVGYSMHNILLILALIWFAFLVPPKVAVMTAVGAFLIAVSVRAITAHVSGMQVTYVASIKAVFWSIAFFVIALLLVLGGFQHFTFAALVAFNPVVVPAILLGAYVLGFHFCLPTSFGASAIVALLSTIASVAIIRGLSAIA
jgi:hypothetical protein